MKTRLEQALKALSRALAATDAPWMIIGGVAVIAHGVRRLTTDIDATVRGDATSPERLLAELAKTDIRPRIDDALAFAKANLVLLVRHEPTGVDLDVSLAWSAFEHAALEARRTARFGRVDVPMATPTDLVVLKTLAGRPKDLEDVEALLVMFPDVDLRRARRYVRELADVAGDEAIARDLEHVIRRARPARRRSKNPTRR